jgi:hypothetical protein
MWEKFVIFFLCFLALSLYALTLHLDKALEEPIIQDNFTITTDF